MACAAAGREDGEEAGLGQVCKVRGRTQLYPRGGGGPLGGCEQNREGPGMTYTVRKVSGCHVESRLKGAVGGSRTSVEAIVRAGLVTWSRVRFGAEANSVC